MPFNPFEALARRFRPKETGETSLAWQEAEIPAPVYYKKEYLVQVESEGNQALATLSIDINDRSKLVTDKLYIQVRNDEPPQLFKDASTDQGQIQRLQYKITSTNIQVFGIEPGSNDSCTRARQALGIKHRQKTENGFEVSTLGGRGQGMYWKHSIYIGKWRLYSEEVWSQTPEQLAQSFVDDFEEDLPHLSIKPLAAEPVFQEILS